MIRLINLTKKNKLDSALIKWAGIFRYLQCIQPNGFTLKEWISLNKQHIDEGIAHTLFRILEDMELIKQSQNKYIVINDIQLQRIFELAEIVGSFDYDSLETENEQLLWTIPHGINPVIPRRISKHFEYLNTWIQNLIQTANKRIIFFSPYYSVAGIQQLMISLKALSENKSGITIDWIVNDYDLDMNRKAFEYLLEQSLHENIQMRIFEPLEKQEKKLWFHAKLLLIDQEKGYMGSANFSERALQTQFELGVPLNEQQTKSLVQLIDFWIVSGQFSAKIIV
ncbi:phospholipase D-like domain-containing protein [Bacillus sp. TH13]|uniref:phospholipase D-like domain-containing protein n=1 Tax=Bacillus sp. TH13 TaxID=2796379 RepID=UPI0019129656|nr:phospholipase D-like domain-containing protein [Bacillus sp. TH13]MBK5495899.1 phospholipase D family protein [Bacillus sp. TH13]